MIHTYNIIYTSTKHFEDNRRHPCTLHNSMMRSNVAVADENERQNSNKREKKKVVMARDWLSLLRLSHDNYIHMYVMLLLLFRRERKLFRCIHFLDGWWCQWRSHLMHNMHFMHCSMCKEKKTSLSNGVFLSLSFNMDFIWTPITQTVFIRIKGDYCSSIFI